MSKMPYERLVNILDDFTGMFFVFLRFLHSNYLRGSLKLTLAIFQAEGSKHSATMSYSLVIGNIYVKNNLLIL